MPLRRIIVKNGVEQGVGGSLLKNIVGIAEGRPDKADTATEAKSRIEALKSRGVDHLMLWFMDAPDTDGMAWFMEEVAPAFR